MQLIEEKTCTKCGAVKPLTLFHKDIRARDGRYSHCICCHRDLVKKSAQANPEGCRIRTARHRAKNPGTGKAAYVTWCKLNRASINARQSAYAKANPEKIREIKIVVSAKRKAQKLNAVPAWADLEQIKMMYSLARRMSKETGVAHHVDHIVPLISKIVCGLHACSNLQIIKASENMSKSNRYWPDMP